MIWSTGGSVTDSIWRYRDIGHVINTPCYHVFFRSFAVLSFELYVQSIVRVLRLLNPCEIQRNALQRYLSLHGHFETDYSCGDTPCVYNSSTSQFLFTCTRTCSGYFFILRVDYLSSDATQRETFKEKGYT